MAQGTVTLPDDSANTGKAIDHFITTGSKYREVVVMGDPSTDAAVGAVVNSDPVSQYGAVVRDPKVVVLAAQTLDYDTGAGTATQVIFGLALPASGGPVAGGTATNPVRVDPVGTTTQPVSIAVPTTGGYSTYHVVNVSTNNDKASIKGSAGHLYGVHVYNGHSAEIFVKLHDVSGVPTPGAAVWRTVGVQAGLSRDLVLPGGAAFASGLGVTITLLMADNDTTVVTAGKVALDVDYK